MALGNAFSLDCSHCTRLRQLSMPFRRVLQSRRIGALRDGAVETRLDDIGMPLGINFLAAAAGIVPYPLGRVQRFDVMQPQFGERVEGGSLKVQEVPSSIAVNNSAITANCRARSAAVEVLSRLSVSSSSCSSCSSDPSRLLMLA